MWGDLVSIEGAELENLLQGDSNSIEEALKFERSEKAYYKTIEYNNNMPTEIPQSRKWGG